MTKNSIIQVLLNCKFVTVVSSPKPLGVSNHISVSVVFLVLSHCTVRWGLGFIVWADLESPWLPTLLSVRLFGKLPGDMRHKHQRYSEVISCIMSKHQLPLSTKISLSNMSPFCQAVHKMVTEVTCHRRVRHLFF